MNYRYGKFDDMTASKITSVFWFKVGDGTVGKNEGESGSGYVD